MGTVKYWKSSVPSFGTAISFGSANTASGFPMRQPATNFGAGGSAEAGPSAAPAAAQRTRVPISLSVRRGSLAN